MLSSKTINPYNPFLPLTLFSVSAVFLFKTYTWISLHWWKTDRHRDKGWNNCWCQVLSNGSMACHICLCGESYIVGMEGGSTGKTFTTTTRGFCPWDRVHNKPLIRIFWNMTLITISYSAWKVTLFRNRDLLLVSSISLSNVCLTWTQSWTLNITGIEEMLS